MNHNQALFDGVFKKCLELGYKTYDYLPSSKVSYPFVHLGEVSIVPIATKTLWLGEASIAVHVWGDGRDRKKVTDIVNDLLKNLREVEHFTIVPNEVYTRIFKDDTTSNTLWHGVLEIKYKFI